ncbi:unnamed protein product, partial [Dovyalis caffra]
FLREGRFSGRSESERSRVMNPSLADTRRPDIGGGSTVPPSLASAPSESAPFDPMVSEVGAAAGEWTLVSVGPKERTSVLV